MKIDAIEIAHVAMPLIYPFRTAFGNNDTIESVFIRLSSGEHYGWGESSPWKLPAYSPECCSAQFLISRDIMAPLLLGKDIESGDDLQGHLSGLKGNYFAKAGFDLAWWDLDAKMQGIPLWQLIGGNNATIEAGADFGVMETIEELFKEMYSAEEHGYKRVKLKFRPGWDLWMIEAVRKEFPDTIIHVDCNSAYTLNDLDTIKELDRYNLAMIEQPLMHDDLLDHAKLQAEIKTPICLDESIVSTNSARKAIECGACQWVNIKPGRVGGITNAVAINKICMDADIPCWIGGMLESAVGAAHCVALATLPNMKYPADIFPTDRFYHDDLGEPEMVHSGPSEFQATTKPGIGVEPKAEALDKLSLSRASLVA